MFKSNIEIREFAINKAVELLGAGAPQKDVVEKAKEIETYVKGEAELPETVDENELISTAIETIGIVVSQWMATNGNTPVCRSYEPIPEPEAEAKKKK